MCRLLGVVARESAPLDALLADDLAPFLALACEHGDGWGIAAATPRDGVTSVKEPLRADESDLFGRTVKELTADAALLHLRLATPGSSVTRENTHPFGDQHMAFAHNGDFAPPTCLDVTIGRRLLGGAEGDTDSERFYLAIRRRIDEGMEPPKAIMAAATDIRALAIRSASLNCLLLTPDALYAYTAHDPDSEVIHRRGKGFFALNYRRGQDSVVVASTGWPQSPPHWSTLPDDHVLEIRRGDLSTAVHGG